MNDDAVQVDVLVVQDPDGNLFAVPDIVLSTFAVSSDEEKDELEDVLSSPDPQGWSVVGRARATYEAGPAMLTAIDGLENLAQTFGPAWVHGPGWVHYGS